MVILLTFRKGADKMQKVILKIDKDGFLIFGEDKAVSIYAEIPKNYTDILLPTDESGNQLPFYRPKLVGGVWLEDITQEEIDDLNNPSKVLTENEMIMLAIVDLDMQREIDKTETQLAIAELVETLLGGI